MAETTPPPAKPKPAPTPLTFEHLSHALQQAEGRMRAMQAQAGGSRTIPLHNVFLVINDELSKLKKDILPPDPPSSKL